MDKTLALGAQVGKVGPMDRADFVTAAVLHERYLKDVFRYVSRRVPRPEEAEDITSEVFAAAFVGLSGFRGDCPPYLWLLTIARRKIIDAQRRRAARRETLASELADEVQAAGALWQALTDGPEAALTQAEARRVLHDLLRQLNPDQREVVLLKYWERLTIDEIAVVMRRSPASVNSLLQRARASLYRRGRSYFLGDDEGHKL